MSFRLAPGGSGTTRRIGLEGKAPQSADWAAAGVGSANSGNGSHTREEPPGTHLIPASVFRSFELGARAYHHIRPLRRVLPPVFGELLGRGAKQFAAE